MVNKWKKLQEQLRDQRRYTPDSYPELFGVDRSDAQTRAVLDKMIEVLDGYLYARPLMFEPGDELRGLLGLDDDEISDVITEVMRGVGRPDPSRPMRLPAMHTIGALFRTLVNVYASQR